jgi:hypothetical protein
MPAPHDSHPPEKPLPEERSATIAGRVSVTVDVEQLSSFSP